MKTERQIIFVEPAPGGWHRHFWRLRRSLGWNCGAVQRPGRTLAARSHQPTDLPALEDA